MEIATKIKVKLIKNLNKNEDLVNVVIGQDFG